MSSDWLVVDLGGVAAHFHPERRLAELAWRTGLPTTEIQSSVFESGLDHDAELGLHTTESITAELVERLHHCISPSALVDVWSLAFEPNVDVLTAASASTRRRALFTNNGPILDLCLAGPLIQVAEAFDIVICSWHLGSVKPSATAFDQAAEQLDAEPSRLLLVDDSRVNVAAAIAAGWQAVHFDPLSGSPLDLAR